MPVGSGCGCTPQAVALASKPDLMITHKVCYESAFRRNRRFMKLAVY